MSGIPSYGRRNLQQNHPQPTHGGNRGACPMGTRPGSAAAAGPVGSGVVAQRLRNGMRKKKIASLASGRTRRSERFRRNLLNSDADRHSTVRPDAVRHGICLLDGAWQGIFLLDAAVSGHFPSGGSRVRAFSFWTQPCQGIFLLDAAMSGQMASGQHVS